MSSNQKAAPVEVPVRGNVFVGAMTGAGDEPCLRLGTPAAFAFEGTVENVGALQAALDPAWAVHPSLRTGGDLVFAHVLAYMAGVGALYPRTVALAHATQDLWRARRLGATSFLYADGDHLYAYAAGLPLVVSNLPAALVVGSPEIVPAGPSVFEVPAGALVSMSRRPQLGWWTTAVVND
jgi:hypothetical protein